jgi:hypothetical protein
MINFYRYYSRNGLDKEHYGILIETIIGEEYPDKDYTDILHIIKKSPREAYLYARYTIKDRWEEAEPYIMKSPMYAARYAKDVMRCKWEEAEPVIKRHIVWWYDYCDEFGIEFSYFKIRN